MSTTSTTTTTTTTTTTRDRGDRYGPMERGPMKGKNQYVANQRPRARCLFGSHPLYFIALRVVLCRRSPLVPPPPLSPSCSSSKRFNKTDRLYPVEVVGGRDDTAFCYSPGQRRMTPAVCSDADVFIGLSNKWASVYGHEICHSRR